MTEACLRCGYDPSARVLGSWTFTIDREPPSLNDRLFNAGPKRWAYAKERDAWCWEFRAARLLQRIPPAGGLRRVTLTRLYEGRQRERDVDNLIGGGKALVDAMVREKILFDDTRKHAEIHWSQERGSKGLRVFLEAIL